MTGARSSFVRAPLHCRFAPSLLASANPSDKEPTDDPPPLPADQKRKLTRKLDKEFFTIAIPAFIQFSAEPLASLVNTMYLGRVGTTALAAAGVAISAQYSVSKLYNDPLLRTSISLVASGQGKKTQGGEGEEGRLIREGEEAKTLSRAVSSALLLAVIVGVIQTVVYGFASHGIIRAMGVAPTSDMFVPAVQYLQVRAVGSPGMTLWLVANGIFRGLGDTVTPLKWALVFTALNAILDPIFIFYFGLGCPGAAIGMVTAQYIVLAPLLLRLRSQIGLSFSPGDLKESLKTYLTSGGFVLIRTIGKIVTYAVCAREAALLGTVASAAYNICFQLGTATTQICESISVAAQALLARELARENLAKKRVAASHVIKRAITAGGLLAFLLSVVTWFKRDAVIAGLSTDPAVQAAAMTIMPLVLWTQVCKGFAYPVNGITMGALDWRFLSGSMWVCNAVCLSTLFFFKPQQSIFTIWIALCLFMSSQCLLGLARIVLGAGPWRQLRGWQFRNARS